MPRGGARVHSGPPPDPTALRRDRPEDKESWTTLPAEGRQGDPPAWPLPADLFLSAELEKLENQKIVIEGRIDDGEERRGDVAKLAKLDQHVAEIKVTIERITTRELDIWSTLWATPQAVMWSKLRWTFEVALYARLLCQAELGSLKATSEARMWSNCLGMNPAAMLRNRWRIGPAEEPAKKTTRARSGASALKRRGFSVIDGG